MNHIVYGLGDQRRGFMVVWGYGATQAWLHSLITEIVRFRASFGNVVELVTKWRT